MLFHKLYLPDGQVIGSGSEDPWAIISVTLLQSVNDGAQLKLGSVCAAMATVELFAPVDAPAPALGSWVRLECGQTGVGTFLVSEATRPSPGRMKLTLYDAVTCLDKDLTGWLANFDGFPCKLSEFAETVCQRCGVALETKTLPNGDLTVEAFTAGSVTGRKLVGWCAELAGCFCHATPEGSLRFGRYAPSGVTLAPEGERFYYLDSLSISQQPVEQVAGVQLRSVDSDTPLPEFDDTNTYLIEGNPLVKSVGDWLAVTAQGIPGGYFVGTVTVPGELPIQAGQTVDILVSGQVKTMPVMEKLVKNGRQTLSCLGTTRRDSPQALSIQTTARKLAQQLSLIRQLWDTQTQQDLFNKLTNNGQAQGVFLQDGQLYINASYLASGIIDAAMVKVINLIAERLSSVQGDSLLQIDGANLQLYSDGKLTVQLDNRYTGSPILYIQSYDGGVLKDIAELTGHHFRLGGTGPAGPLYLDIHEGKARLDLDGGTPRTLSWTYDSALEKYVLTGS